MPKLLNCAFSFNSDTGFVNTCASRAMESTLASSAAYTVGPGGHKRRQIVLLRVASEADDHACRDVTRR